MIVGLHHVAVGVDDFDKGLKFYTEALGFEVVQQAELENNPMADGAIGLPGIKAKMAISPNPFCC